MSDSPDPVDYVNHPPHYQQRAIECLNATRGMAFDLGNCVKYIYRAPFKGNIMQDLEKARFYLADHMAHSECHRHEMTTQAMKGCVTLAETSTDREREFFYAVADGRYGDALEAIEGLIGDAVEQD